MPGIRRALALAVALVLLTVAGVQAQWPTTCVEANDAFEANAGRFQNVGIYQRVYGTGAAAEAACRQDHRDDIRAAFWWAVQGADPAPAPAPPAPPAPPPPPAQPTGPVIDPSLHHVWHLLSQTATGATLLAEPAIQSVRVQWGATAANVVATYTPATHTITMGTAYRDERPEALAAILAHELAHAASGIPAGFTYDECLRFELWAFLAQGLVWLKSGLSATTPLEWTHQAIVQVILSAPLGNADHDLSDWGPLLTYIGVDLGYFQTCAP